MILYHGILSYEERVEIALKSGGGDKCKAYDYLQREHSSAIDRVIAAKPDKIARWKFIARLRQRRIHNWLKADLYGASRTSSQYYNLTFGSGRPEVQAKLRNS